MKCGRILSTYSFILGTISPSKLYSWRGSQQLANRATTMTSILMTCKTRKGGFREIFELASTMIHIEKKNNGVALIMQGIRVSVRQVELSKSNVFAIDWREILVFESSIGMLLHSAMRYPFLYSSISELAYLFVSLDWSIKFTISLQHKSHLMLVTNHTGLLF